MELTHHPERSQFVLVDEDGVEAGVVLYELRDGVLSLVSAEVPPERQGQGLGAELVGRTLTHIQSEGLYRIQPVCPFIAKYMMKHPEFDALRA